MIFKKNLDVKKINGTSISQPNSGVLSGYIQSLQIWSQTLTAQILLVFEIWRFFMIFLCFFFQKNLDIKKN